MTKEYETVIGLEVHVELSTKTKIFCGCKASFGAAPNTHTCPVCTGMPGALPVLNKKVPEYAMAVGLALNCRINRYSRFDRKNYFYPDNPQNYQISQLYQPLCKNGAVEIETKEGRKTIGIHEIHMEEDAGKLIHDEESGCSFIDYNRSGVPLIEIVSEPDMRSAEEAVAYLEKLRTTIQYLGVSDCRLNEGSMRADVNLSVREKGASEYGTRTEMKNLNSFKGIIRAVEAEKKRQIDRLNEGKKVIQETRRWDDKKACSYSMRSKEDAKDYRYFPDPDLMPLCISKEWIRQIKSRQPEFQEEKAKRYRETFGLPAYDISILTSDCVLSKLFEETVAICHSPKKVSNWLMGETMRLLKEKEQEPADIVFTPERLAEFILLLEDGVINQVVAKEVFVKLFEENIDTKKYVADNKLSTIGDEDMLREMIGQVIRDNPQSVKDYGAGKKKAAGFLVGQTMKKMQGKADPGVVNRLIREMLS